MGCESQGFSAKLADQIRSQKIRNILYGDMLPKKKEKAPLFKETVGQYLKWAKENKTREGIDDKRRYDFMIVLVAGEKNRGEIRGA